jgi:hypothetical protein
MSGSAYEAGFAAGEHESYIDRRAGRPKLMPPNVRGHYAVGYWDGYTPRTQAWRTGMRVQVSAWWIESEREDA